MLTKMKIQDYPQMQKSDRKKLYDLIHSMAYPRSQVKREVSTEEIALKLRASLGV